MTLLKGRAKPKRKLIVYQSACNAKVDRDDDKEEMPWFVTVRCDWPAAAVIPAPVAYIKVVAVKKLVVGFLA